jgi:hypothetical protein
MRAHFSWYEDEMLRRFYPDHRTDWLAVWLGWPVNSLYRRANWLGLKKSVAFMASDEACYLRRHPEAGLAGRFRKGQPPWNKGLKHPPGWGPGRMRRTQYKKGNHPQTWRPLGTTRFSKDGYLQRKVRETGRPARDWVGEHVLAWEKRNGPVPAGHAVAFRDGDKSHIRIGNLELVSRSELMRRNSVHNLPKDLQLVIQLAGALNRQIRKRRRLI